MAQSSIYKEVEEEDTEIYRVQRDNDRSIGNEILEGLREHDVELSQVDYVFFKEDPHEGRSGEVDMDGMVEPGGSMGGPYSFMLTAHGGGKQVDRQDVEQILEEYGSNDLVSFKIFRDLSEKYYANLRMERTFVPFLVSNRDSYINHRAERDIVEGAMEALGMCSSENILETGKDKVLEFTKSYLYMESLFSLFESSRKKSRELADNIEESKDGMVPMYSFRVPVKMSELADAYQFVEEEDRSASIYSESAAYRNGKSGRSRSRSNCLVLPNRANINLGSKIGLWDRDMKELESQLDDIFDSSKSENWLSMPVYSDQREGLNLDYDGRTYTSVRNIFLRQFGKNVFMKEDQTRSYPEGLPGSP